MIWAVLSHAALIFGLSLVQVSVGTLRTIMMTRGRSTWAAVLGFAEVTVWLIALGQVVGDLDTLWKVFSYSGGYMAGTLVGMWLENRLALGHVDVHIISTSKGLEIGQRVRQAGYGATQLLAEGRSGPVQLIEVVAARRQVSDILRLVNEVDAASFVAVREARQIIRGYQHLTQRR